MTTTPVVEAQASHAPEPARSPRRAGWSVALRIARRESWRAKGRSALVLLLIMLPVLVVAVASTLLRTALVSTVESLPRELGAADVSIQQGWKPPDDQVLVQCPDLSCTATIPASELATRPEPLPPEAAMRSVLGPQARIVAFPTDAQEQSVGDRSFYTLISEIDLAEPLLDGMLELIDGRAPAGPGEVAVSERVAQRGAALGSTLDLGDYGNATVVGTVRSHRAPDEVVAAPGGLGVPFADPDGTSQWSRWLVSVPGGVSWDQVLSLNEHGLTALSRDVVTDPPTRAELAADPRGRAVMDADASSDTGSAIAVIGLILAMVLLEVILLAGPAFAVGASSQTRALGLLAAQGGTRRQLRRVVLAQAVVLGGIAAVAGVVIGLVVTRLAYPFLVSARGAAEIGPFEIGWGDVALVAAFGFGSAVVASLAPARAAARMDPVRAIGGRRPEARARRWHPVLGLVLIGLGAALAWAGSVGPLGDGDGSAVIAIGAVLAVIGAVLIAPLAITLLAAAASRAPLSMRYAFRDMARNQLRTAPAVAAVAAVVAGAVALSISGSSDSAQSRAQYVPGGPRGDAVVWLTDDAGNTVEDGPWQAVADEIQARVPDSTTLLVRGVPDTFLGHPGSGRTLVLTSSTALPELADPGIEPGTPGAAQQSSSPGTWWYGSAILIGDEGLDAVRSALTDEQLATAQAALSEGAVVILRNTPGPERGDATFDLVAQADAGVDPGDFEGLESLGTFTVPAVGLHVAGVSSPAAAIVPESLVAQANVQPTITAVVVDGQADLTRLDEERLQNAIANSPALAAAGLTGYVSLDLGWVNDLRYVLLILGLTAGVLVLAGSMTAALLALSDARADFATLGAVGAAPRTRRRIAGAYGWAIAFLGACLGAVVGFIPGVAISYPLTSYAGWLGERIPDGMVDTSGAPIAEHYLVIPWPMIAVLVIGLPLLVGLVVALSTRSRLPMVARIE